MATSPRELIPIGIAAGVRPAYNVVMKPVQSLSEEYRLVRVFDLKKELKLLLTLNLIGLVLFTVFGSVLFILLAMFRPEIGSGHVSVSGNLPDLAMSIIIVLAAYAGALALHELIHGICFWMITRALPRFGLGSAYAFTAAPDWYIPRNLYLIVGLAPLIVITLVGLALLPALPTGTLMLWWFVLTVNASGAVGDMYVVGWLLTKTSQIVINDHGDRIAIYAPTG